MLETTGEGDELIDLALDAQRHRRMREVSGSDRAALDEIVRAHSVLVGRARPDVATALRLARHRCACETAGEPSSVEDQIEALSELLWALNKTADQPTVVRVADRLVRATAGIDQDSDSADWRLAEIVQTLAGVGQVDQAAQVISAVPDPRTRGEAQRVLALMLADAGDFRRAERIIDTIAEPDTRSTALIELMSPLTEAGDRDGALRAAQRAQEYIATTYFGDQAGKLDHLVQKLLHGDHVADARRVAERAAEIAVTVSDPYDRDWSLLSAVHALSLTGQVDRAEQLVGGITDRSPREVALLKLGCSLGDAGDFDQGLRIAATITDVNTRSTTQGLLVLMMAEAGDFERAESTAAAMESPSSRSKALRNLAGAMAAGGDRAGAQPVVQEAERVAATIMDPATRSLTRGHLVDELIHVGDFEQAELIALTVIEDRNPVFDLGRLARAMAETGDTAGARRVLDRAEPFAVSITDSDSRAKALSSLADDMLAVEAVDDAVRLLVQATGSGVWYRGLSTAAALDPYAVRVLAEDMLAEEFPPSA